MWRPPGPNGGGGARPPVAQSGRPPRGDAPPGGAGGEGTPWGSRGCAPPPGGRARVVRPGAELRGGSGRGGAVARATGAPRARRASGALADLIPLTVPEVRRLLWGVVWRAFPSVEQVLAWSAWRRHHQAVAKRCHYQRHGAIWP